MNEETAKTMTAEEIVRKLAEKNPMDGDEYACGLCLAPSADQPGHRHNAGCLHELAREWVRSHSEDQAGEIVPKLLSVADSPVKKTDGSTLIEIKILDLPEVRDLIVRMVKLQAAVETLLSATTLPDRCGICQHPWKQAGPVLVHEHHDHCAALALWDALRASAQTKLRETVPYEYTEALPLSYRGLIYAWACKRCRHVASPPVKVDVHTQADIIEMAAHSLDAAKACCLCRRCNSPLGTPAEIYCDGCATAVSEEAAAAQAQAAAQQQATAAALDAHMEEQLAKTKDRGAALRLLEAMQEISETCYSAGWINGLERSLWKMVCGGSRDFGGGTVDRAQVGNLHDLAELAGGWWTWEDSNGQVFVPLRAEHFPDAKRHYRVFAPFEDEPQGGRFSGVSIAGDMS